MAQSTNIPTLEQALDDVEARFLYNLPKSELEHTERLFFQIEQAYWFYEDFKADVYNHLPHFATLKSFATKLFTHSALLSKAGDQFQELFADFRNYKSKIPVFGCIMLNPKMTKVVLVCDYNGKSWTFPRGKINEKESEFMCATREVQEETGFDPSPHCREEDHLLTFIDGKQIKLFIACNVPESTEFCTMTRKEIDAVAFHPLDALPKTYAVNPFLDKLKRWINKRKQLNAKAQKSPYPVASQSPARASAGTPVLSSRQATPAPAAVAAPPATKSRRKDSSNNNNNSSASPQFKSASPTLNAINSTSTASHPSPGTMKRLKNQFDMRNGDTFENDDTSGWGVNAMFAANAKITGKNYVYDGNPHQFGASHPKYVNYTAAQDAVSSRSVFGSTSSFPSFASLSPTPLMDDRAGYLGGIALYAENTFDGAGGDKDDDSFRALSEQSLLGQQLLRSEKAHDPHHAPNIAHLFRGQENTAPAGGSNSNNNRNNNFVTGNGASQAAARSSDFALPMSAFQFDTSAFKPPRHDSFDSTHSKEGNNSGSGSTVDQDFGSAIKVIFPVNFTLNKAAVMEAFDRALCSR